MVPQYLDGNSNSLTIFSEKKTITRIKVLKFNIISISDTYTFSTKDKFQNNLLKNVG